MSQKGKDGRISERRPLIDGLKPSPPPADPAVDEDFVFAGKKAQAVVPTVSRVPLSTRIRSDFFASLKRASLERQLNKTEPHTLIEILEEAIEPWLKSNGYLR
jgi:hypothetical protein